MTLKGLKVLKNKKLLHILDLFYETNCQSEQHLSLGADAWMPPQCAVCDCHRQCHIMTKNDTVTWKQSRCFTAGEAVHSNPWDYKWSAYQRCSHVFSCKSKSVTAVMSILSLAVCHLVSLEHCTLACTVLLSLIYLFWPMITLNRLIAFEYVKNTKKAFIQSSRCILSWMAWKTYCCNV